MNKAAAANLRQFAREEAEAGLSLAQTHQVVEAAEKSRHVLQLFNEATEKDKSVLPLRVKAAGNALIAGTQRVGGLVFGRPAQH